MPKKRNWDQAAGILWPALTKAASEKRLLTYGDLSPLIETNPLSVGWALGPIQTFCLENHLPPLTAIVVGRTSGVPGGGFIAWDVDDLDSAFNTVFRFDWKFYENPFVGFSAGVTEASLADKLIEHPDQSAAVYTLIKNRGVSQRVFPRALMKAYKEQCCFCGYSFAEALQAAHIIPWGEYSSSEKMDVRNGILLCSNHHGMFDSELMTITEGLSIEFYDPEGNEGPYSKVDRTLSIDMHDQVIRLPENPDLRPSDSLVKRRRKAGGWR